jgi:hypothetical protein
MAAARGWRVAAIAAVAPILVTAPGCAVVLGVLDDSSADPNVPTYLTAGYTYNYPSAGAARGRLTIFGDLAIGTDAAGRRRPVDNDTLTVLGYKLGPTAPAPGTRAYSQSYRLETELTPAEYASLPGTVSPPAVRGAQIDGALPSFSFMTRLSPDTVTVGADGMVRVELQITDSGTFPVPPWDWSVYPVGGTGALLLSGKGAPPPTLSIPAEMLPFVDGACPLEIYVVRSFGSSLRLPGEYMVGLNSGERFSVVARQAAP